MPHTNTRIYVDTSTDPPTGITHDDIGAVLVRSARDNGQLCGDVQWDDNANAWVRVNAINKFAKYKPVRKENMLDNRDDWWRAGDGNCGLSINHYEQLSDLVAKVRARHSDLLWEHLPPRGAAVATGPDPHGFEPYRLLDFNNYIHNAEFPMPYLFTDAEVTIVDHDATYSTAFAIPTVAQAIAQYSLGFSDIRPTGTTGDALGEYYFGAVLVNEDEPSKWCVVTSENKLKNESTQGWNGWTIYGLDDCTSAAQAYSQFRAIPFFSSIPIEDAFNQDYEDDITGDFVTADNNTGEMIYVHINGKYDLAISQSCIWSDPFVRGTLTIEVTTGPVQNVTLTNVQVNVVEKNDHTVVINGQNFGTVQLAIGASEERASKAVTVEIYASVEEGFDPTKEYVLELTCDQLVPPAIYTTTSINIVTS